MSKEGLEKLNQDLLKHYKETGIDKALYYEPFEEQFWERGFRLVYCNLEPYDTGKWWTDGYHKVTTEVFEEGWKDNRTIRFSMKLSKFVLDIANKKSFSNDDVKKRMDSDDLFDDFKHCAYMNMRPTFSSTVAQNPEEIKRLYSTDPFYKDFLKKYIEELKDENIDEIFILAGKDSNEIINEVFPDMHLEFDGAPVWQNNSKGEKKYMFISMKHPSSKGENGVHFSNEYACEILKRIKDNW